MDIQFYGANCISIVHKATRIVVDDNLADLGKRSILKPDDIALFTGAFERKTLPAARLILDSPGEYEVADISIMGLAARHHQDEPEQHNATMYKITAGDINLLVTGHVFPQFDDSQLEAIGLVDVVMIPVGGHGYTLDPKGALTVIKEIEPKLVIPTHYESSSVKYPVPQLSLTDALKEIGMEPKETAPKLKLKPTDLSDVMQLVVLEVS